MVRHEATGPGPKTLVTGPDGGHDGSMTSDVNLDHQGLEVLSTDECWELAASTPIGRVAFVEEGEPMVLPINHGVVADHVVFRTTRGALLDEALMARPVAFEVDGWDAADRTGWSVVIRGLAHPDDDEDNRPQLDAWADAVERDEWVRIVPEEVTGRRIVR